MALQEKSLPSGAGPRCQALPAAEFHPETGQRLLSSTIAFMRSAYSAVIVCSPLVHLYDGAEAPNQSKFLFASRIVFSERIWSFGLCSG